MKEPRDTGDAAFREEPGGEPPAREPVCEVNDHLLVDRTFTQSPVFSSIFDTRQRFVRINDAAARLIAVTEEGVRGRHFREVRSDDDPGQEGYYRALREVAATGEPTVFRGFTHTTDMSRKTAWHTWVWPLKDEAGRVTGVAAATYDNSEEYWARERMAVVAEASSAIGSTLDLVRTADELAAVVVPRFADVAAVDLLGSLLHGDEPVPGPPDSSAVLCRVAYRAGDVDGGAQSVVDLGDRDTYPEGTPPARCLASGAPVLSGRDDPGLARWAAQDPTGGRRAVHSLIAVPLRARGSSLGVAVLARVRRAEPFDREDLALAEELASRAAVCVDNARRYGREHATALALQRSLLPRRLPAQAAVEVAHRYLPAGSSLGVGGDWFDVIPLSGTRVALVVGDVVGHGIHASATMGRLRTAVRTLADVDLPPDELLTHLDDLVTHLNSDDRTAGEPGGEPAAEIGATCLYAVYDPVSRECALASAGHPPPLVVRPGGTPEPLPLSPGPPLGVGSLPFESSCRILPEGSVLALYTDGLVEARDGDIEAGMAALARALATAPGSLELACDTVLKSLLPERPTDDVALLIARTRALHTNQVVSWDLSTDPAVVAEARTRASAQLAEWDLEAYTFVTELVVSELVTNAIRYGGEPIRLRLIRDRSLICEVSDGSSTAPHLRRAHTFDEGGRGLLLVAQLTQGWGTRQTPTGKTIWAEQALH
ncbi:SpoIIE family protein phosphatase [Streptomyces capparidis]